MTHEEVYQELAKEREAVTQWWRHQLRDQRRRALKCQRFPMHIWKEHTSTRKNRYVFFSRVFDKHMKTILTGVAVIRHTSDGLTVYTTWLMNQRLISPMVMQPHMWRRYAERTGTDLSGVELIRHYFARNGHGKDSDCQQAVGRSVRYNGEEHLSCCVPDGVLLGQRQGNLFVVRTFITYEMTSGLQEQEFEACRKQILTDRQMYDEAAKFYRR
jgi:hypothetical protein